MTLDCPKNYCTVGCLMHWVHHGFQANSPSNSSVRLAADLGLVGLPKAGWLQLCQSAEGKKQWRQAVQNAAIWGKPQVPQTGDPPERKRAARNAGGSVKRRQGHEERIRIAEKRIRETIVQSSKFLQWEAVQGGRESAQDRLRPMVAALVNETPDIQLEEVVHQLFEGVLGEAVEAWDTEADLAVGRLSVSTAFYSVVRGVNFSDDQHATGVTPHRVSRKQSEPAWHLRLERERKG